MPIRDMTTSLTRLSDTQAASIIQVFKDKAAQAGCKQGSKAYRVMHFDYFIGAMATLTALDYVVPATWSMALMTNRDLSDDLKPI